MKKLQYIYENGSHKWAIVARDVERPQYLIDTNEYLVINDDRALLTDPGGIEIFPAVFSAINEHFDASAIDMIFSSHQDPDIISSLSLWLEVNRQLKCNISWLWSGFVPHFGGDKNTFIDLPDEGAEIRLQGLKLQAIPAHYLHSSGNFHLYDPVAKILFSGDIGAALSGSEELPIFVSDFDRHIQFAKKFHQRWLGSNEAKQNWCQRIAAMDIDMLCPQHGSIYTGDDVERFINWLAELPVGVM